VAQVNFCFLKSAGDARIAGKVECDPGNHSAAIANATLEGFGVRDTIDPSDRIREIDPPNLVFED
jgi:hypothetical protein